MMDRDDRTSIATREARNFRDHLYRQTIIAQIFMIVVLSAMSYLAISERWLLVVGFFLGTGTVCSLIIECAERFDAIRNYPEQSNEIRS